MNNNIAIRTKDEAADQINNEVAKLTEFITRPKKKRRDSDDIFDDAVKAVGTTIGFVSEVAKHRKEKNKSKKKEKEGNRQDEIEGFLQVDGDQKIYHGRYDNDEDVLKERGGAIPGRFADASASDENTKSDAHLRSAVSLPRDTNLLRADSAPLRSPTQGKLKKAKKNKTPDLTTSFLSRHKMFALNSSPEEIPYPIVIPQRRPSSHQRGFVQAYPPILSTRGISQTAFLDFINTLNTILVPEPYLAALNLVGEVGRVVPEPVTSIAIGIGVGIATEGIIEGRSRWKGNAFLDKVNEDFFGPRGLVCSVVKWKKDGGGATQPATKPSNENADEQPMDETMTTKSVIPSIQGYRNEPRRLQQHFQSRLSASAASFSTQSFAPLQIPDPAELKNAHEDTISLRSGDTALPKKKENVFKRADNWMDDYADKRAQAHFVNKHEDAAMSALVPKPSFRSRYADPAHPANSGSLLALVTGGKYTTRTSYASTTEEEGKTIGHSRDEPVSTPNEESEREEKLLKQRHKKENKKRKQEQSMTGTLAGLLKSDQLYLMIVANDKALH